MDLLTEKKREEGREYISEDLSFCHNLCYVICNRNAANMDVVALYLSEQLNNNFILYTREINFSVHIYIFCPPSF